MQQIITAKLKLLTTPEQCQALRQTQLAYRDALNVVSRYAYAHGKLSNAERLQQGTYRDIRRQFQLPAQMACNVPRQVGATYKGLWKKARQNAAHRRKKWTRKRFKGLDKPPKYVSPTLTYNCGRDYGFKPEQQVSILTLQGHIVVSYQGYERHLALIRQGAVFGAAKLWYDKPRKQFYLLVSLELEVADPTPEVLPTVVGVDVVSTVTQIGRQSGQLRFSRPKSVRPVSVPSSFQQVIDSGVASQTNQAGTSPLKPGTAPPL